MSDHPTNSDTTRAQPRDGLEARAEGFAIFAPDGRLLRADSLARAWLESSLMSGGTLEEALQAAALESARLEFQLLDARKLQVTARAVEGEAVIVLRELGQTELGQTELSQSDQQTDLDLRASRDAALSILDGVNNAMAVLDRDGRFEYANLAYAQMIKRTRDQLVGQTLFDISPPVLHAGIESMLEQIRSGEAVSKEITAPGQDGVSYLLIRNEPRWTDGQVSGTVISMTDLTDLKVAWSALEESRSFGTHIMEAMSQGLTVTDLEGRFEYANPAFCEMVGRSSKDIVGKVIFDLVDPTEHTALYGRLERRSEGKSETFETRLLRPDGSLIEASVQSSPRLRDGRRIGGISILTNITEQRQREAAVRQDVIWVEDMINSINGVLWESVNDGSGRGYRQTFVSPQVEFLLGYTPQEWMNDFDFWEDHLHPDDRDRTTQEFVEGNKSGRPYSLEFRMFARTGQAVWIRSLVTPRRVGDSQWARGIMLDITQRKQDEERLQALTEKMTFDAHHDALTGLPNRVLFEDRLQVALEGARRHGVKVAVMFLDLDRFKQVNDSLGHAVGDELICQVAQRLAHCLRLTDTLARRGGDEFTLVLPDLTDPRDAARVAHRLMDVLASPFHLAGQELFVTASLGISLYPLDGEDADTLQRNADVAMYHAKAAGRNGISYFDADMNAAAHRRLQLESDLRRALDRGELEAFYQPQMDAQSGQVVGFEALVRWRHPEFGLIPPLDFIPMARETGMIGRIDVWMLRQASHQIVAWDAAGLPRARVAVNVSSLRVDQMDLVDCVRFALLETTLSPDRLELELSETFVLRDPVEAAAQIVRLRELGVSVAMDDFGTGNSSLSLLHQLPFNRLKIDRSFVVGLNAQPSSRPLIEAMTVLAHKLQMDVVIEGVETLSDLDTARQIGCDIAQGFLYSRPVPALEAEAFLRQYEPQANPKA